MLLLNTDFFCHLVGLFRVTINPSIMKNRTLFMIVLSTLFWGCTRDALQSDIVSQDGIVEFRGKNFVPFKGEVTWVGGNRQGVEGPCAQVNPAFTTINYAEGSGRMTHMGKITYEGSQCVDLTGTVMSPLAVSNVMATMIAANGDEVYIESEGANLIPTDKPTVFLVNANFTVTGGSGRFEGAEGGGTLGGQVAFTHFPPQPGDPPAPVINIFDGMIAY